MFHCWCLGIKILKKVQIFKNSYLYGAMYINLCPLSMFVHILFSYFSTEYELWTWWHFWNKTLSIGIMYRWSTLVQSLMQGKSNHYYIFCGRVFSYRYPACNALAPYCHLWTLWLYNIFPHYLIKNMIFKKS
jgi:hypothetical protein